MTINELIAQASQHSLVLAAAFVLLPVVGLADRRLPFSQGSHGAI